MSEPQVNQNSMELPLEEKYQGVCTTELTTPLLSVTDSVVACDIWNWYKPSQSTSLASQESLGTRSLAFDEAQLYAHPSNEPMNLDNANRLRPLYSDRGKLPGLYSPQLTVYRTISTSQVDSMVAVEGTLDTFDSILSSFVWPDRLDFLLARGRKRPELANTPHNALWIDQREKLCGLVVELQGILTHGSTKIHEARNDAISLIRSELSSLDEYEIRLWQKNNETFARKRQTFWRWLTTVEWS